MNYGTRRAVVLAVVMALSACTLTRGSSVLVGTRRPAIEPAQVKLYLQPPRKYEQVAILSADARNDFASQQNLADNTVARLKQEAAKLGANGVLLSGVETVRNGSAAVVMPGTPTVVGMPASLGKEGSGLAIFVTEE